ncbi:MAG TPA: hypothetical protein VGN01_07650 [Acidobacteriaceae bacterium]|jgi:hypothetical protein
MQTITGVTLEGRAVDIMEFLHRRVFDPALASPKASKSIKAGVRKTILRMEQRRTANGMIKYFWAAVYGTERSIRFADMMAAAGFDRFEEVLEDFRRAFPLD